MAALGCRYGMLAGGAGGYLLRTPAASILVDPGPAALGILATAHGTWFSWTELDAIGGRRGGAAGADRVRAGLVRAGVGQAGWGS